MAPFLSIDTAQREGEHHRFEGRGAKHLQRWFLGWANCLENKDPLFIHSKERSEYGIAHICAERAVLIILIYLRRKCLEQMTTGDTVNRLRDDALMCWCG